MAAPILHPAPRPRITGLRHDLDLSTESLGELLELTQQVKQKRQKFASGLKGRYVSLLFEKPSLRTRMTFELAIKQLGGDCVVRIGMIGDREPLKDVARNVARWTDAIVARTFAQETVDELAKWSGLPVVNALSDLYHPCQALADMFTLKEQFGRLRGLKLAYIGDGNNVAHSLLLCCARLGIHCSVATPPNYEPKLAIVERAAELACGSGGEACGCCLYRRLGQHGAGVGSKRTQKNLCTISGQRSAACAGARRYAVHALPAGEAWAGSDRRRPGIGAVCGLRSSGKPAARTKSSALDVAAIRVCRRPAITGRSSVPARE